MFPSIVARVKRAVTALSAFMTIDIGFSLPLIPSPLHPTNSHPFSGTAVRATVVPLHNANQRANG